MSSFKNIIYFFIDVITFQKGVKRKINNHIIRFQPKWSRYYESNYEKENYMFLQQKIKPGMHIVDIGAHIGLFSAIASALTGKTGKIICFEPTPGTYAVLRNTLRLNKCANVTAVQAAVSNTEGEAVFYIADVEGCNSNSLVKNKEEGKASGYPVKLVTIDKMVEGYSLRPSLIKIDAEGAELDVLKGGGKTFNTLKPMLIVGLHPDFIKKKGDSLEEIWDLLASHGYRVGQDGKFLTKKDFCEQTLLFDVHCI